MVSWLILSDWNTHTNHPDNLYISKEVQIMNILFWRQHSLSPCLQRLRKFAHNFSDCRALVSYASSVFVWTLDVRLSFIYWSETKCYDKDTNVFTSVSCLSVKNHLLIQHQQTAKCTVYIFYLFKYEWVLANWISKVNLAKDKKQTT